MLFELARPLLHAVDPEQAHRLTIAGLKAGVHPRPAAADPEILNIEAFGLRFPNPLGIAAGFDKNAEVPDAMLNMGMGFAEVGTVTPKPQKGNPTPRHIPSAGRSRCDQPAWLQQRGPSRGACTVAGPARPRRHRRRQYRRQQGHRRHGGGLCAWPQGILRPCQLLHRQYLLAQHSGPAWSAVEGPAGRSGGAASRRTCRTFRR